MEPSTNVTSLDPIADFVAVAGVVVGAANVHEIVQPSKLVDRHREFAFPSVVFAVVGDESTQTLKGGPFRTGTALRYEARAKVPADAKRISDEIISALRKAGILKQLLVVTDDFDDDLEIHRRIQSVMLS